MSEKNAFRNYYRKSITWKNVSKFQILYVLCILMLIVVVGIMIGNQNVDESGIIAYKPIPRKIIIHPPESHSPIKLQRVEKNAPTRIVSKFQFSTPIETITFEPAVFPLQLDIIDTPLFEPDITVINICPYENGNFSRKESIQNSSKNRTSMQKELIRPKDLDYGKFKSMIFRKSSKKRDFSGFIRIPAVWGTQLRLDDIRKSSVINLVEAINRYTGLRAYVDSHLMLDSQKLKRTPFVYITTESAFELSAAERRNFGDYLRSGGFAVIDNGSPEFPFSQAEASMRQMLRDSLGAHARFLPIPASHQLYHCFFDFDDGPPQGYETRLYTTESWKEGICSGDCRYFIFPEYVNYLEGIWFGSRLVAIYSDKGYGRKWKRFGPYFNNEPQLKMGVNMVVFALTQAGGIARQNTDFFSAVQ